MNMIFLVVAVAALGLVSCDKDPEEVKSYYEIDGVEYLIDSTMFWYQSPGMGGPTGNAYIRLINDVEGQEHPNMIKLTPNMGFGELPGTYTWADSSVLSPDNPEGTYNVGFNAAYAGMANDWIAVGEEGSANLVIEMTEDDLYHITGDFTLETGSYDFMSGGAWVPDGGTKTLKLDYTGAITPL